MKMLSQILVRFRVFFLVCTFLFNSAVGVASEAVSDEGNTDSEKDDIEKLRNQLNEMKR